MSTILYYITYGFLWLISLLPLRVLYVFSDMLYFLVRRYYRREVVREQLKGSFPEKTEAEIEEIEKKFYHAFCDFFAEDIKAFSISKKEMMRRVTFGEKGLAVVQKQFDEGKDYVFVYLGHYCNWEWLASFAYWTPSALCCQLYTPLENELFDRIFLKVRQRYGGECIDKNLALRRLLQLRKEGKKVFAAFITDQLPQWKGMHHFMPFLNRETAVFVGGEQMAKKFNASVVCARIKRPKRGHYSVEYELITDNPKEVPDYEITDTFMRALEEDIVRVPHMWLWTHKRWKRSKEEWLERQRRAEESSK